MYLPPKTPSHNISCGDRSGANSAWKSRPAGADSLAITALHPVVHFDRPHPSSVAFSTCCLPRVTSPSPACPGQRRPSHADITPAGRHSARPDRKRQPTTRAAQTDRIMAPRNKDDHHENPIQNAFLIQPTAIRSGTTDTGWQSSITADCCLSPRCAVRNGLPRSSMPNRARSLIPAVQRTATCVTRRERRKPRPACHSPTSPRHTTDTPLARSLLCQQLVRRSGPASAACSRAMSRLPRV